jgi:hypothetical protein
MRSEIEFCINFDAKFNFTPYVSFFLNAYATLRVLHFIALTSIIAIITLKPRFTHQMAFKKI